MGISPQGGTFKDSIFTKWGMMPTVNVDRANDMATTKKQLSEKWLKKAITHLETMFREAEECADEGDVMPTKQAFVASVQILETFQSAHQPTMGLTVNGEVSLAWANTSDEFRAYVKPDGSVQYFQNKQSVDERSFSRYLTAVSA